ncbi:hypothetical protein ACN42_g8892 [Penicillium freii]|uniref:Uncharacterized protein n=1 Tax=Penicillium freii TaxID=48697 RepID=A0A101MD33_PENFR|nr:hypothetical protein ACN42_g8892 [Penicillium freii]
MLFYVDYLEIQKYVIYPVPALYGLTLVLPLVLPGMSSQVTGNQPKPNHKSSNTDFQNQYRQMRTVKVNGASQVPWGRFTPATYNTAIIIAISNNTLHWTSDGSTGILSTLEDLY